MYKNFTLTESEREQILNMHKEHGYGQSINEQDGGFKEDSRDYDHWKDVRIQLIDSGFKNDTNKNMEQYGTSHSLSYGGHNGGVNVLWNKPNSEPWSYIVWVGNNEHMKTFPLGGSNNSSKSVASQVIKYALSLMSLVSKKPINEGLGLLTGQECYMFGEVYVCVGDKSEYVMDLQKQLNQSNCQKGLPPISLNGVFGPETKERIKVNQKSNCKVPGFNTQQYKRVKTPTGEKYVPVKVSGTNLAEQDDTSFLDNKVNYLIQQGYKVVDKISLPDGEYNLLGWGYTCYLNKDNKNTGFVYVTTGGIRGSWENQKVNVMGGKIQKVSMGEVYKMLYNQTKVGHVGLPLD